MNPVDDIVEAIRRTPSRPDLFNHYQEFEAAREDTDAPAKRRQNLAIYLRSFLSNPPTDIWIAECPSRYGARWSGVPFTHQRKLSEMTRRLRTTETFLIPSKSPESKPSQTSDSIWAVLPDQMPLLWNVVMLHPFKVRDGQIRNEETSREHHALARESLQLLLRTFRPKRVIAIGGVASKALGRIGVSSVQVAHPGRNRHALFWSDMAQLGIPLR